jgi:hypothetical protein
MLEGKVVRLGKLGSVGILTQTQHRPYQILVGRLSKIYMEGLEVKSEH